MACSDTELPGNFFWNKTLYDQQPHTPSIWSLRLTFTCADSAGASDRRAGVGSSSSETVAVVDRKISASLGERGIWTPDWLQSSLTSCQSAL
jgi:hypothetical protein